MILAVGPVANGKVEIFPACPFSISLRRDGVEVVVTSFFFAVSMICLADMRRLMGCSKIGRYTFLDSSCHWEI